MNAMEKLAREISRVTKLLAYNETIDRQNLPQINMKPVILMERTSIERACIACGSNDPQLVIGALADLEGFTS